MTDRKSFEDILSSDFRWPTKGDKPFVVADSPLSNANIPENERSRLVLMTEGYKKAADLMVTMATDDRLTRDILGSIRVSQCRCSRFNNDLRS